MRTLQRYVEVEELTELPDSPPSVATTVRLPQSRAVGLRSLARVRWRTGFDGGMRFENVVIEEDGCGSDPFARVRCRNRHS